MEKSCEIGPALLMQKKANLTAIFFLKLSTDIKRMH